MNNERESDQSIPYVKVGDYYFPNFALPPDAGDIGFWGRRRREVLREHRPVTFSTNWCCLDTASGMWGTTSVCWLKVHWLCTRAMPNPITGWA